MKRQVRTYDELIDEMDKEFPLGEPPFYKEGTKEENYPEWHRWSTLNKAIQVCERVLRVP